MSFETRKLPHNTYAIHKFGSNQVIKFVGATSRNEAWELFCKYYKLDPISDYNNNFVVCETIDVLI
jgi:hypothetical protein